MVSPLRAWCGSIRLLDLGPRFIAARGSLAGLISIGEHFELADDEIDEMLGESS
jgi:hypothetical protein